MARVGTEDVRAHEQVLPESCTCLFEAFVASAKAGVVDNRRVRAPVTKPAVASETRAWFVRSLLPAASAHRVLNTLLPLYMPMYVSCYSECCSRALKSSVLCSKACTADWSLWKR